MKIKLSLILLFCISCLTLNAQWTQTNGPFGGTVNCFAISGSNIFAGTNSGIFLSTNNGSNWIAVNNGLPISSANSPVVRAIAISGSNIFLGLFSYGGGMYLSTNNGGSWSPINNGFNTSFGITSFAISGSNIFAATTAFFCF